jgi:hypothetical protein
LGIAERFIVSRSSVVAASPDPATAMWQGQETLPQQGSYSSLKILRKTANISVGRNGF